MLPGFGTKIEKQSKADLSNGCHGSRKATEADDRRKDITDRKDGSPATGQMIGIQRELEHRCQQGVSDFREAYLGEDASHCCKGL